MSTQANKEIARQFIQVWTPGHLAIVDELAAPDIAVSWPALPFEVRGAEGFKAALTRFYPRFSDSEMVVDDLLAEGGKVAARWTYRGTHQGVFRGIPPTGKQVTIAGMIIYRIVNGKVVEERGLEDLPGLFRQLGASPAFSAPPQAEPHPSTAGAESPATTTTRGFIAPAGQGRAFPLLGGTRTMVASSQNTGGALEVVEGVYPARAGMPLHVHRTYDEAFYVLAGELTIHLGDRVVTAPAGSFAFVPRGTPHTDDNLGPVPCRLLAWTTPAMELERLVDEVRQLPPDPPDGTQLQALLQKYDTEIVGTPLES